MTDHFARIFAAVMFLPTVLLAGWFAAATNVIRISASVENALQPLLGFVLLCYAAGTIANLTMAVRGRKALSAGDGGAVGDARSRIAGTLPLGVGGSDRVR
jgi:hypothetical protein